MTKTTALRQSSWLVPEKLQLVAVAGASSAGADGCFQAYARELDYLLGSLRRLGVPLAETEDVAHEVFLVMHRRWEDFDRLRPLRPWLFGIAFRVASRYRRNSLREVLNDGFESEDPALLPDEAVAASEAHALLLKALSHVPLERRAVLVMHDLDEVSMRDIATELSIALFTAYSRLRKARKELDAALLRLNGRGRR